ncbi:MAG TPA: CHASE2 domain-containing protein [Thioploca sp.]|nr:MAG: hypothetical protein DRR19_02810 [Gammaproteobacteria bacterium]HDN27778.1 CHASE2 domain-containing protein [Thioploca sp.]
MQQLLHFAVSGQAAVIIVDIDLSYPRDPVKQKRAALSEADLRLYHYLADYEAKYCKATCPHILLVRSFRQPTTAVRPYPAQRPTFLDNIVAKSPHLHWASVLFDREKDRILRRWQLWETTCSAGQPEIVPSVSLLTLALLTDPKQGIHNINKQLQQFRPASCDQSTQKLPLELNRNDLLKISDAVQLHPQPSRLNRLIFYTIPWKLNPDEQRPNVPDGRFLLETLSAKNVLEHLDADSTALLHNSITVIGGSYIESRDLYATPLGWMPGALILMNAVHTMLQHGELNAPPSWVLLAMVAVIIGLMSLLLIRFDSFWGMTFSGLVIIIIILPISFWVLEYGVWLDFAIPLLIVQLRQMAADYEEAIKKCTLVSQT